MAAKPNMKSTKKAAPMDKKADAKGKGKFDFKAFIAGKKGK